jgi:hypothetical protein
MRILHEQGRGQAGLNWGEPESPQCRGFTVEELSRIDFSNLNLSEIFEDLKPSFHRKPVNECKQNPKPLRAFSKCKKHEEGKTE